MNYNGARYECFKNVNKDNIKTGKRDRQLSNEQLKTTKNDLTTKS
jgi:hypothetical protein